MITKSMGLKTIAAAGVIPGAILSAVAGIVCMPGIAGATPPVGFAGTVLAKSTFEEIQVNTLRHEDDDAVLNQMVHLVKIQAKDPSDVYVVQNTISVQVAAANSPVPTSGWHSHPGPSIVLVKTGTVTVYHSDDPTCAPTAYTAGSGFIDEGGDHAHLVRNEGLVPVLLYATQIVPAGTLNRRIDVPVIPAQCHVQ